MSEADRHEAGRIETELWLSFVSLLRSYFAVASMDSADACLETNDTSIRLAANAATLKLSCDPATGAGKWTLRSAARFNEGRFTLQHDGTIALDGESKELDMAAIDLVAALMHAENPS
jgi:hypothetical protein